MGGVSCYNYHARGGGCRAHIEQQPDETEAEFYERAGRAGWVMGHADGQAHFACPSDAPELFDPTPLDRHYATRPVEAPRP